MSRRDLWRFTVLSCSALLATVLVWRYADNDLIRFAAALGVCLFGWLFALGGAAQLSAGLGEPFHAPFNSLMVFAFAAMGAIFFLPGPVQLFVRLAINDQGLLYDLSGGILARSVELAVARVPSVAQFIMAALVATAAYFGALATSRRYPFLVFATSAATISFILSGTLVVVLTAKGVAAVFASMDKTGRMVVPRWVEFQELAGSFLRLYALCIFAAYAGIAARLWRLWAPGVR